jgi:hypothetical protein
LDFGGDALLGQPLLFGSSISPGEDRIPPIPAVDIQAGCFPEQLGTGPVLLPGEPVNIRQQALVERSL